MRRLDKVDILFFHQTEISAVLALNLTSPVSFHKLTQLMLFSLETHLVFLSSCKTVSLFFCYSPHQKRCEVSSTFQSSLKRAALTQLKQGQCNSLPNSQDGLRRDLHALSLLILSDCM